jgi:hypothetical protein
MRRIISNGPFEFFRRLGENVESKWRVRNYEAAVFPKIAAAALAEHPVARHVDALDIIRSVGANRPLPSQMDVDANFSNLPITLFSGTRFYIDIYFWLDGTTSIHQHGFAGAFQVLLGSSLHSHYEFTPKHIVSPYFAIGTMSLKQAQLLSCGDIKQIIPGNRYIHSLFHLERPSATITVRTIGLPTAQPQFSYLKPGIAYDPFFKDTAISKKVQSVNLLLGMQHPDALSIVKKMIAQSDLHTAFTILGAAYHHLGDDALTHYLGVQQSGQRWGNLLRAVRIRHGASADIFPEAFAEMRRQAKLIDRRGYVAGAELRFFLALLLNVAGRKQILSLVRQRYPKQAPIETVLNWIEELSQIRGAGARESNALGIDEFGDKHLLAIECLLKGKALRRAQSELRRIFRSENAQGLNKQIETIYKNLKQTPILAPLFAEL